jgi:pimeloyl-ACP methyl ester carboxylesterase
MFQVSRSVLWGIAFFGVLGIFLLMMNRFVQSMIYPAPPVPVPTTPPPSFQEPDWELDIHGWLHEPEQAGPKQVLLYFHGNGENLETMRQSGLLEELQRFQIPFLVIDYPGYGRSKGKPSEHAILNKSIKAVEWLNRKYPDHSIILCGWSLGASVAIQTAANSKMVNALIVISGWTSLREVAEIHFSKWFVDFGLKERFDALEAAKSIHLPALVIHGEQDDLIPVSQGKRIAETMKGPVRWISLPAVAHNDLLSQTLVWTEIEKFLTQRREVASPKNEIRRL